MKESNSEANVINFDLNKTFSNYSYELTIAKYG